MKSAHEVIERRCLQCGIDISHKQKTSNYCSRECYRTPRFHGTYCSWCKGKIITSIANKSKAECCSRRCSERLRYHEKNPDFKEDYFSEPNLDNSYWAGFIAGDGCINDKDGWQNQVRLSLSVVDKLHLDKLQQTLGAGSTRHSETYLKVTDKTYPKYEYALYSDRVCKDLADNFNIHPKKSLTHEPPNLTGDLAVAFIAGYIDADGSYTYTRNLRPVITAVGTDRFLSWMNNVLEVKSKTTCCGNFFATYIGGDKAIKIRESIHDLNLPLLERKRYRWEELNLNLKILNKG